MDRVTRRIIRHHNKQVRKSIVKLPNLRWSLLFAALTAILLWGSYILFELWPWAANVLISAGCGCFTGLAFYFLSNLRNNKITAIQKECAAIKETLELLRYIIGIGDYHIFFNRLKIGRRDAMEDGFEILSKLDELESARNNIAHHIYDTVVSIGYDPTNRDNIDSYRDRINQAEDDATMEAAIVYICKELIYVADELKPLLEERENQLMFMGKYLL